MAITSLKGKRTIFVGGENYAHVTTDDQPSIAGAAGILPGNLLQTSATGFVIHATAGATDKPIVLIADMPLDVAQGVNTAYASGDTVNAFQLLPGMKANVLVATGQTITKFGTPLTSNGAGLFRIATPATEEVLAYADEIITTSATTLVRVRGA